MWKTLKSGEILSHVEGHIFSSRVYEAIPGSIRKINWAKLFIYALLYLFNEEIAALKNVIKSFPGKCGNVCSPREVKFFLYIIEAKIESEFNLWSVLKINKLMNTIANSLFQFQSLVILMDRFQANSTLIYSNCLSTHTCQK